MPRTAWDWPAGLIQREAMAPYGNGYLLVAEDGGVFNFSDQHFEGSFGDRPPAHPVVSVASAAARARAME